MATTDTQQLQVGDNTVNILVKAEDITVTKTYNIIITREDEVSIINFSSDNLTMYPNPVNNTLYIESSSVIKQVSIYDISGRIVRAYSIRPNLSQEMGVSDLANGIYLVKVKTAEGETIRKIVKE